MMVFPNPSTHEINIVIEDNFNGHFEIYNTMGVSDASIQAKHHQYRVTLNQGTYILVKRSLDGIWTDDSICEELD